MGLFNKYKEKYEIELEINDAKERENCRLIRKVCEFEEEIEELTFRLQSFGKTVDKDDFNISISNKSYMNLLAENKRLKSILKENNISYENA